MNGLGFSQAMMSGVLSATTMMSAVKAQSSAIAKTEGRIRVLESEIKLGTGATESKQEELSAMKERLEKAKELQLGTIEDANRKMDKAIEQADTEESKAAAETDEAKEKKEDGIKTIKELYQEIADGKASINELLNSKDLATKSKEELMGIAVDYML